MSSCSGPNGDTFAGHGVCDFVTRLATDERDGAEQPEGRDAP